MRPRSACYCTPQRHVRSSHSPRHFRLRAIGPTKERVSGWRGGWEVTTLGGLEVGEVLVERARVSTTTLERTWDLPGESMRMTMPCTRWSCGKTPRGSRKYELERKCRETAVTKSRHACSERNQKGRQQTLLARLIEARTSSEVSSLIAPSTLMTAIVGALRRDSSRHGVRRGAVWSAKATSCARSL